MAPITVTVKQATQITNLSHTTIYALIKEGRISKTKIGRRTLLQRSELVDLVTPTKTGINTDDQFPVEETLS